MCVEDVTAASVTTALRVELHLSSDPQSLSLIPGFTKGIVGRPVVSEPNKVGYFTADGLMSSNAYRCQSLSKTLSSFTQRKEERRDTSVFGSASFPEALSC